MKLSAWRDDLDIGDARRLLKECRGCRWPLRRRDAGATETAPTPADGPIALLQLGEGDNMEDL